MAGDRRAGNPYTMGLAGVATIVAIASGGYQLFSPKADIERVDNRVAAGEKRLDEKFEQLRKDLEWRFITKETVKLYVEHLRDIDKLENEHVREAITAHQSRLIELERASRDARK